ncbi:MAG TPA: hypothetical protein VHC49_03135 [Mycobacteriales bacterium]|nr:hypothetical protein [Mycobacteriales bacterium]
MSDTPTPDADAIAAAVASCPGVARLHGGMFGEVATYLPGRRVVGVQVGEHRVAVHIVARLGPLQDVADGVRGVVTPLAEGFPVDVVVEDVALDDEDGNDDEHDRLDE